MTTMMIRVPVVMLVALRSREGGWIAGKLGVICSRWRIRWFEVLFVVYVSAMIYVV